VERKGKGRDMERKRECGAIREKRDRIGRSPQHCGGLKQDERIVHFTFNGIHFLPCFLAASKSFRLFVENYGVEGDESPVGSGDCFAFFNESPPIANANGSFWRKHII
jgi:hypothetical protein